MNRTDDRIGVGACPGVTPYDVEDLQAAGALVLDVRQPEEWHDGHIAGAVLIPLPDLADRFADVPTDRVVVVVCRSGNRSGLATTALRRAGIDAVNLEGGMTAWFCAGLPSTSN